MTCPFCDADNPELISLYASQLLLSQYRCRVCGTYFEGLRDFPGRDPLEASPNTRVVPTGGERERGASAARGYGEEA